MKQSIGSTFLLNFIIVFFVVTFAFLLGIMSYMKAFKLNSEISNAIENNEGYNFLAKQEIDRILSGFGYRVDSNGARNCPTKKGQSAIRSVALGTSQNYRYCIYEYPKKDGYFRYGVTTYIYLDLPVVSVAAAIPVYSETEKMYRFK